MTRRTVFEAHDGSEKLPIRRNVFAEGKRHDEPHAYLVVRHAGGEEEPILRKINDFADIFDIDQASVKGPDVNWQGQLDSLAATSVVRFG